MSTVGLSRSAAAAKGGLAVVAKYGPDHISTIGRKGAESFWLKYKLVPIGTRDYQIVDRITGNVIGTKRG